jgi:ABC-type phosphate transport system substrate-binding protein
MELLMKIESKKARRAWWGLLGLALVNLSSAESAEAGGSTLVVITAKDSPVNGLSLNELKQIYLGASLTASDGSRILALNRGSKTRERVGFDRSVLDMDPEKVSRYWIDRRIRGQSGSPKAVDPGPLIQRLVTRLPGAIAYVSSDQVDSSVKVVKINGLTPKDSAYPIHH